MLYYKTKRVSSLKAQQRKESTIMPMPPEDDWSLFAWLPGHQWGAIIGAPSGMLIGIILSVLLLTQTNIIQNLTLAFMLTFLITSHLLVLGMFLGYFLGTNPKKSKI